MTINIALYPVSMGNIPVTNGKPDYVQAYSSSLVLFLISYTLFGFIFGGFLATFSSKKNISLKERTIDKSLTAILVIQAIFFIFNIVEFLF